MILLFSSLSMYWSLNMWQEPNTASLPASFVRHKTSFKITSQVYIHNIRYFMVWEGVWKLHCASYLSLMEGQDRPVEGKAD